MAKRVVKKRGHGEGSWSVTKAGKQKLTYTKGTVNGKQKRGVITGDTKEEVWSRYLEIKVNLGKANRDYDKMTFEELCQMFFTWKQPSLRENTRRIYATVDKYLFSKLYPVRVNRITADIIDEALNELQKERKLSNATVNTYKSNLAAVFNYAIRRETITKSPMGNTAKRRDSKGEKAKKAMLTETQIRELLQRAKEYDSRNLEHKKVFLYPLILLALFTGCRFAELLAIKREDIEGNKIKIRGQVDKKGKLNEPKTRTSYRSISLEPRILDEVQSCFPDSEGRRSKGTKGFLLSYEDGSHYNLGSAENSAVDFLKKNRDIVPDSFTFHDLRHTFATFLLSKRVNVHMVSRLLGHGDITTTLKYYADSIPEDEEKAKEALRELLV